MAVLLQNFYTDKKFPNEVLCGLNLRTRSALSLLHGGVRGQKCMSVCACVRVCVCVCWRMRENEMGGGGG